MHGFEELAVANANAPLLELFDDELSDGASPGNLLALRLVASNRRAAPAPGAEPRVAWGRGPFRLYTNTASWCSACRRELPQLGVLRHRFGAATLGLYGVPVERDETPQKLADWRECESPGYELLIGLGEAEVAAFERAGEQRLRRNALPMSVLVGPGGEVRAAYIGVPSVSELRRAGVAEE